IMSKLLLLLALVTVTVLGANGSCGSKEARMNKGTDHKLATSVWGGDHIHAEVTEGGATMEFDCARGAIEQPIVLDGAGKFELEGKFATEHAGPITRDDENGGRAVRYAGILKDKELTLTITDPSSKEIIGTFNLTHGNEG